MRSTELREFKRIFSLSAWSTDVFLKKTDITVVIERLLLILEIAIIANDSDSTPIIERV